MSGPLIGGGSGATAVGGTMIGPQATPHGPRTPRHDDDEAEVFAALLPAPAPRARPGFVLTPLADVMFQLLIFFMLSSSLAPYAVLPLAGAAAPPPPAAPPDPAPDPAPPPAAIAAPVPVWHLGRGEVRAGAERFALEALAGALEALSAQGIGEVIVFTTSAATAGDVAALLEAVLVHRGPPLRARLVGQEG